MGQKAQSVTTTVCREDYEREPMFWRLVLVHEIRRSSTEDELLKHERHSMAFVVAFYSRLKIYLFHKINFLRNLSSSI